LAIICEEEELPNIFGQQKQNGLADLILGTDSRLNEVLARVPDIQRGPQPPFWLRNRHIQFIPFLIQNEVHRVVHPIPFQRIAVPIADCHEKPCESHSSRRTMNDTVTLDVFPPFDSDSEYPQFDRSSPIILYSPGLRCYSQDMPGNSVVRKAFGKGMRSIVFNRRGHTPNQPLKSPRWNLFGDVDDLEQIYWYIKDILSGDRTTPIFLYGISSGTAATVSALSKWDKRRRQNPLSKVPAFVASAHIVPGYGISRALKKERFLWPYNEILVPGIQHTFVRQNEELLRSHNNEAVDQLLSASDLHEFLESGVVFAGYENVTQYFQEVNPVNEIRDIETPQLVLNSMDDPCCNIQNLYETSPYPHHEGKSYAAMGRETKSTILAVTRKGSHCPFVCSRDGWLPLSEDPLIPGGWMIHNWADHVTIEFFSAALDLYNDRRFL